MSRPDDWLLRLYCLAARHSDRGACSDLAAMSLADLWGLYQLLTRIADGGQHGPTP